MDHVTWYTIRAAGISAYLLLFLTVATGLVLSGPGGAWWKGIPILPLHRFLTWLMGAFLAVHVLVLLVDNYLRFSVLEVLEPFAAQYEPFWTGVGVLAMYLVVLVVASTAVRRELHNLLWYGLHLLSYPAFVFSTAHGITTGADTKRGWMWLLYVACAAIAAALLAVRFTRLATGSTDWLQRWGPGVLAGGVFAAMVLVLIGSRVGYP
jgi:sulfoxide reductase heme-binding subunit YedZ